MNMQFEREMPTARVIREMYPLSAETLRRNDEMARLARECPEIGRAILEIKQGLIARGQYGFDKAPIHFHSPEIYAAVVEKGARSLKDFLALCLD